MDVTPALEELKELSIALWWGKCKSDFHALSTVTGYPLLPIPYAPVGEGIEDAAHERNKKEKAHLER